MHKLQSMKNCFLDECTNRKTRKTAFLMNAQTARPEKLLFG
tara:strand:+ start:1598 stop:1720 length:123 start_codon:yes stop_codon:yes gene_type:complete